MKELIQVTQNENGELFAVLASNLHKGLEIGKDFTTWVKFISKYGFEEGLDYTRIWIDTRDDKNGEVEITSVEPINDRWAYKSDYLFKIEMAKEVCMIQRTEKGRQCRKYFIECEKKLKQLQLPSYQISDPIERAKTWIKEEEERQRLALENKTLTTEVIHKEDVILGLTKDISLAEKRQRITQIVRFRCKGNYGERYGLLYSEFEKKYHIDLKRRMESCTLKPKVKNKMDYIDRGINMIPELYEIACKIFENDVDELRKEWEQTIERKINNLT